MAVALLASLGYNVVASSGRAESLSRWFTEQLGASEVIGRLEKKGPLGRETWIGVVDTVGGDTLSAAISQLKYKAAVAACGVAGGPNLPASVFPFILRGVRLLGVDSVQASRAERERVWRRLERDLDLTKLQACTTSTVGLVDVVAVGAATLLGQTQGRVVVDVDK